MVARCVKDGFSTITKQSTWSSHRRPGASVRYPITPVQGPVPQDRPPAPASDSCCQSGCSQLDTRGSLLGLDSSTRAQRNAVCMSSRFIMKGRNSGTAGRGMGSGRGASAPSKCAVLLESPRHKLCGALKGVLMKE